ncbi:MAG: hypothetical protein R3245_12760, partial [Kiloniellales bacterium]|nr:hypothetical protein [Kiloniellales bacterium]
MPEPDAKSTVRSLFDWAVNEVTVVRNSLAGLIASALQPRELFLRGDGRVSYLTLSTRAQALILAGGMATILLAVGSFGIAVWQGFELRQKGALLAESQERYRALSDELDSSFVQYSRVVQELEANQEILLSLLTSRGSIGVDGGRPGVSAGDLALPDGEHLNGSEDDPGSRGQETVARGRSLTDLRGKLDDIAHSGHILEQRAAEITKALEVSQAERR